MQIHAHKHVLLEKNSLSFFKEKGVTGEIYIPYSTTL